MSKTTTDAGIAQNHLLAAVLDCSPVFFCQHTGNLSKCKYYEVIDKDFYSIKTGCRYLGMNGDCFNKSCIENACRCFLNGG